MTGWVRTPEDDLEVIEAELHATQARLEHVERYAERTPGGREYRDKLRANVAALVHARDELLAQQEDDAA